MPPNWSVRFYCTATGKEPVRDWLIEKVTPGARKAIGADMTQATPKADLALAALRMREVRA